MRNEDLCIIESAEIAVDRALLALNTHDALADIDHRAIELRCFGESADFETSQEYFEDATKELDEKREGILKTLWRKIKELFEKIRDTLFGKKKPVAQNVDANAKVRVKGWIAYVCNNIKKAWNGVKSALANGKKKLSENGNWKKLLAVLGVAGAGVALAAVFTNKKKKNEEEEIKAAKIKEADETFKDIFETCEKVADSASKDPSKVDPENAEPLKKMANAAKNVAAAVNNEVERGSSTKGEYKSLQQQMLERLETKESTPNGVKESSNTYRSQRPRLSEEEAFSRLYEKNLKTVGSSSKPAVLQKYQNMMIDDGEEKELIDINMRILRKLPTGEDVLKQITEWNISLFKPQKKKEITT